MVQAKRSSHNRFQYKQQTMRCCGKEVDVSLSNNAFDVVLSVPYGTGTYVPVKNRFDPL